jgi:hypothetical protein
LVAASALTTENILKKEVKKNQFGSVEITESTNEGIAKTVYVPSKNFNQDYER